MVIHNGCVAGAPHYDSEGSVCGNDGQATEAYCSYDVSPTACAYCGSTGQTPRLVWLTQREKEKKRNKFKTFKTLNQERMDIANRYKQIPFPPPPL